MLPNVLYNLPPFTNAGPSCVYVLYLLMSGLYLVYILEFALLKLSKHCATSFSSITMSFLLFCGPQ